MESCGCHVLTHRDLWLSSLLFPAIDFREEEANKIIVLLAKILRIHDEQLHIASQGVGKQELIFSLMAEETLCLRWNGFQDIAQTSFRNLKNDKDFMDVTLAVRIRVSKHIKSFSQRAAPSSRGT